MMREDLYVTDASEWRKLPELPIPEIASDAERGSVCKVLKVGFLLSAADECSKLGISAVPNASGKCALPTVVIEDDDPKQLLFRLPLKLAEWAESCVAMAHAFGAKLFPANVEFGVINGHTYAEIL